MFKRGLAVTCFLFLLITVCVQSAELFLNYYVLFPIMILPVFFLWEKMYRSLFPFAECLVLIVYLVFALLYPSVEMGILGLSHVLLLIAFFCYDSFWRKKVDFEINQLNRLRQDLDQLQEKHGARLESLHHLEKQVAGLLDLFEIARDFNDCLSFDGLRDILTQRVMPELPFRRLRLVLFEPGRLDLHTKQIMTVSGEGYQPPALNELDEEEKSALSGISETKTMVKDSERLSFPLISDGEMSAALMIEGTEGDDLAKFEVLAAYLTLQVKKNRLYETVKERSIRDGLTGLFVRRHFLERFDEELKRSLKHRLSLAVLMLDIDHFKRYNDEYGHLAGDTTLKQVAGLLRENLRKVDIVGRYGGEEFIVVIPETRQETALEVAERVRSSIARHQFRIYNDETKVTVSIGISLFPESVSNRPLEEADLSELTSELIRQADLALYRAKEEGRNRVVL